MDSIMTGIILSASLCSQHQHKACHTPVRSYSLDATSRKEALLNESHLGETRLWFSNKRILKQI